MNKFNIIKDYTNGIPGQSGKRVFSLKSIEDFRDKVNNTGVYGYYGNPKLGSLRPLEDEIQKFITPRRDQAVIFINEFSFEDSIFNISYQLIENHRHMLQPLIDSGVITLGLRSLVDNKSIIRRIITFDLILKTTLQ